MTSMKPWSLIPLVTLLACGAAQQNSETLADSIRSYNDGVRWQRFEVAATLVPARERSKFVEEMDERADDLKITNYDVVKVDRKGAKAAEVQVKVSWYRDSEGTLRETHALQTWERHGKAWLLVAEARMRGAEMPGLPDEPEAPELAAPAAPAAAAAQVAPADAVPVH